MDNKEVKYDGLDVFLAAAMVICGFLYWDFGVIATAGGITVTMFTAYICVIAGVYLRRRGFRQNRRSLVCLALIALMAANYTIFDAVTEQSLGIIVMQTVFIYWIMATTKTSIAGDLSAYVIGDALKQIIIVPFANFFKCPSALARGSKGRRTGGVMLAIIVGVCITIPVAGFVVVLLSAADSVFGSAMSGVAKIFKLDWLEYLGELILGLPVAFYLFGLIFGDASEEAGGRDKVSRESFDRRAEKMHSVPVTIAAILMTVLNVIYIVFLVLQASYLFAAFRNVLPEGMTYAGFARSGFFQLCLVAVINLAVVLCAQCFSRKVGGELHHVVRVETAVTALFTIGLAATAFRKMYMYIATYGLTQLRVYTSLFMIFLVIVFVVIGLRQLVKFNGTRIVVAAGIIMFMVFMYGNIDGHIAKYDLQRYEAGTLDLMDENVMTNLGPAAVPYLYDAYGSMADGADKEQIYSVITGIHKNKDGSIEYSMPANKSWKNWNLQRARADKIADEIK